MAVAGEVEVAVGAEGGEQLVAGRVDGCAQVLGTARLVVGQQSCAPDVVAPQTAGHVAHEVEPLAVGRHSRVGVAGERVLGNAHLGGLAPGGIAAAGSHDGGVARIVGIGLALGEVHRPAVGGEGAGPLVEVGIQL